ncbi:GPI transamidase component [Malassezia cuniculi]|uniref:GPI transamidase component n=1 Tax=Malassezia cuniculi TaxID=948313 RepID=A0AAF0JDB4_9BASI|nr:GPI transamidase component [Malassezia cuniculi]
MFQEPRTRISVLAALICVFIACVPVWWATTTIERLPLPVAHVSEWSQRTCPVRIGVNVAAFLADGVPVHDALCDASVAKLQTLSDGMCIDWSVDVRSAHGVVCASPPVNASISYPLQLLLRPSAELDTSAVVPRDADLDVLASTVAAHLAPFVGRPASDVFEKKPRSDSRAIQYVPRVRLVFSLLNEDAAAGGAAAGWELGDALESYTRGAARTSPALAPLAQILDKLSGIHEFELESQVQWYAPLDLDLDARSNGTSPILTLDDLSVFINSEQWNLESYGIASGPEPFREHHSEHTLHFVLFLPSAAHSPLVLRNALGEEVADPAWLVPQWGGVAVSSCNASSALGPALTMDELAKPIEHFASQLARLLGIEQRMLSDETPELRRIAVDGLLWRRTLEASGNAVETLASIVHLVEKITILGVSASVRDNILLALSKLDALNEHGLSAEKLLSLASDAQTYASRAFFHPSMLAMLYFPDEHKYAVYTPLFGPLTVPLIATVFREISQWKARRRAQAAAKSK